MSSKLLLRIAAVLITIHLLGHTIGHLNWDNPTDPGMAKVVRVMKGYQADFMGASKSMADYHTGYSIMIFGLFGMSIVILWLTSGFINENRLIAKKVVCPVGFAYIFFGIAEYMYFFPFAAATSFIAGLLIMIVLVKK
ncbi:hypothetical protein HYN59_13875 [Flavobacterium album]|uniref:Uncharacterized protein n=1 Tax=Flavobacterium album TaxID=2175091 RepID=A0A2S1R0S2_9FLAO|nr:hypothetical protein [Flavobacterium album]AWH86131.1 hypothetical protein HYN59_13875 [Flavobacterium album]